jgi:hypothetical protein
VHVFVPLALADEGPVDPIRTGIRPQPVHVYQPRGPPQA